MERILFARKLVFLVCWNELARLLVKDLWSTAKANWRSRTASAKAGDQWHPWAIAVRGHGGGWRRWQWSS
jgi:hypothetical protein